MQPQSEVRATPVYKPILFWFGFGTLVWIAFLLYAGGFTTSIRAGMAFLDWPLSNGSINPEGWLENEDMLAEHSHRLLGAVMGLLSIALCATAYLVKGSQELKKLGVGLVILVVTQGLLGGLRVKLDTLNLQIDHNLYAQTFAVIHATLAQIFLCTLVAFAVMASRSWIDKSAGFPSPPGRVVSYLGITACLTLVLQLIVGAVMRHSYAGLAITSFPYSHPAGYWIPPAFDFKVAIHFAHRIGAIVVTGAVLAFVIRILKDRSAWKAMKFSVFSLISLLGIQIYLGALTIWTVRNPHVATFHMLNGAFLLAVCWMMTLRSLKFRLDAPVVTASSSKETAKLGDLDTAKRA